MRAPPDSMKPTTGAPARPASRSTRDDRVGVRLAERAAEERRVLRVAEDRPAVDAAGAGDHAVAGARLARPCARERTSVRSSVQRAGVAERLEPLERRQALRAARLAGSSGRVRHAASRHEHGVVAAEAERVRERDGGCPSTSSGRACVRARSRGRGPRRAPRARASAARPGRAARASSRPPRRRRRRRAGGRSPTCRGDRDLAGVLAERRLDRAASRRGR